MRPGNATVGRRSRAYSIWDIPLKHGPDEGSHLFKSSNAGDADDLTGSRDQRSHIGSSTAEITTGNGNAGVQSICDLTNPGDQTGDADDPLREIERGGCQRAVAIGIAALVKRRGARPSSRIRRVTGDVSVDLSAPIAVRLPRSDAPTDKYAEPGFRLIRIKPGNVSPKPSLSPGLSALAALSPAGASSKELNCTYGSADIIRPRTGSYARPFM